jgi:hypothetical protein
VLSDQLYIPCIHTNISEYKNNIFSKINFKFLEGGFDKFSESNFYFSEIPEIDNNLILSGYFQSEKYFKDYEKEIKDIFNFESDILNKYKDILNKKNCSLHIRRGDFLNLEKLHPVQDLDYYKKAISHFDNDTNFLIFSNDTEWCKLNLNKDVIGSDNLFFIENNNPQDDLLLMSKCDSNIIANSTFSWWGAWLNQNPNKKVIAPLNWLGEEYSKMIKFKYDDLIPKEWISI